jgi:hypothetical protein
MSDDAVFSCYHQDLLVLSNYSQIYIQFCVDLYVKVYVIVIRRGVSITEHHTQNTDKAMNKFQSLGIKKVCFNF